MSPFHYLTRRARLRSEEKVARVARPPRAIFLKHPRQTAISIVHANPG